MSNLVYFVILVAVVALIVILRMPKRKTGHLTYPYHSRSFLLSPAERSFLGVLDQVLANANYRVFAQVRLADVVEVDKGIQRSAWQRAFNTISRKHVDFVACRSDDMCIVGAIELDDESHAKRKRKERDHVVDQILAAAGIPLIRIKAAAAYAPNEIKNRLTDEMHLPIAAEASVQGQELVSTKVSDDKNGDLSVATGLPNTQSAEPTCPKCGSALLPRVSKKGKHQGEKFWGCSSFPNCKYIAKRE